MFSAQEEMVEGKVSISTSFTAKLNSLSQNPKELGGGERIN